MEDLSHVFANEPEEGQKHWHHVPSEAKDHFAAMFAHAAGVGPHPGVYKGPPIIPPEDWETPEDMSGQKNEAQSEAIDNLSSGPGTPPHIPGPPKTRKGPPPIAVPPTEE